jgi:hypothetical protein
MRYAAALVALFAWLVAAMAAPLSTSPNSRATAFVIAVATRDLRSARQGGQHVLAYERDETEATLSSSITEWLTQGDRRSLRLALADQETIFAFHWRRRRCPPNLSASSTSTAKDVSKIWLTGWRGYEMVTHGLSQRIGSRSSGWDCLRSS